MASAKDLALEAGEGEMRLVRPDQRAGKRHGLGIAFGGRALDRRTAGKAQAEKLGALVEGFARRVVDGGGEAAVAADALDEEQLAMASRNQEEQEIGRAHV